MPNFGCQVCWCAMCRLVCAQEVPGAQSYSQGVVLQEALVDAESVIVVSGAVSLRGYLMYGLAAAHIEPESLRGTVVPVDAVVAAPAVRTLIDLAGVMSVYLMSPLTESDMELVMFQFRKPLRLVIRRRP